METVGFSPNIPVTGENSSDAKTSQNPHWITTFTQDALAFKTEERMAAMGKKITEAVPIENITIPSFQTHTMVGWDAGKVVDVTQQPPLYTKEIGPCIGVLARLFEGETVTHTALHHIFCNPEELKNTLKTLIEKTKEGTIEFFITGGDASSIGNYNKVIKIIEKLREEHLNVNMIIQEDLFRVADLGKPCKLTQEKMLYRESCGLQFAGFDEQHRPYQIVDVSSDRPCKEKNFTRIWL